MEITCTFTVNGQVEGLTVSHQLLAALWEGNPSAEQVANGVRELLLFALFQQLMLARGYDFTDAQSAVNQGASSAG